MRIGLIGYRRHSARILGLLAGFDEVSDVAVFHPDPAKLAGVDLAAIHPGARPTSDTDDLLRQDAVLITSPTQTHVPYIEELIDGVPYLFCEKPPAATQAEVERLRALEEAKKSRIHFNFNYRFSTLGKKAREVIDSGRLGRPLHFDFASAHGLAFKPGFKDDWRAKPLGPLFGIFGNVGIHYVDLCLWLLGDLEDVRLSESRSSTETQTADSASAFLRFRGGATAAIFTSYAAPFVNQARLVFNDGFLTLEDGRVRLFTPRETFDSNGLFATPPATDLLETTSREYFDRSLRESLAYFLAVASSGGAFEERDFDLAMRSNAVILSTTTR